jgi:hypothetical protein
MSAALETSMNLSRLGVNSWFKGIERILKFCNLDYLIYTCDMREITCELSNLKKRLSSAFIDKWKKDKLELLNANTRLQLFINAKDKFESSTYLNSMKVPMHRIAISKLRLSAHRLPIETGRYDKVSRWERLCPFGCDQVGDEQHYFLNCKHPFLQELINPFVKQIIKLIPNWQGLEDKEKLLMLLETPSDEVQVLLGKFSYNIFKIFKDLTS